MVGRRDSALIDTYVPTLILSPSSASRDNEGDKEREREREREREGEVVVSACFLRTTSAALRQKKTALRRAKERSSRDLPMCLRR